MTIDEFEIGKPFRWGANTYICVDKGVKSVVYVSDDDDSDDTDYWMVAPANELTSCRPFGDEEQDADNKTMIAGIAAAIENKAANALVELEFIKRHVAEIKRICK